MSSLVPIEIIEKKIYLIRGQKAMLDRDLAVLYGVTTFNLNKAVKRNRERFPQDFMFRLTEEENANLKFQSGISNLKSQSVISTLPASKAGWGGRRTRPFAFTENGVAMLSSVLRSGQAVRVNIQIMRVFARLREILSSHKELAEKFQELVLKVNAHDSQITAIFTAIRKLLAVPEKPKKRIGFFPSKEQEGRMAHGPQKLRAR